MKKLSKIQAAKFDSLSARAETASTKLEDAILAYNEAMADLRLGLQTEIDDYNDTLSEFRDFAEEVRSEGEAYMEEKSEKWQEEQGEQYREWIGAWEALAAEDNLEIPEPDTVDESVPMGNLVAELSRAPND